MLTFSETQRFRQWWIWLLLLPANILVIWGFIQQVVLHHPWGDKPAPDELLTGIVLVPILVTVLFFTMKLTTSVDEKGITYRFYPLQMKNRFVDWNDVSKAYVREYRPIGEYGGWGLRLGIFGSGRAVNVSGNKGLQLVMKNGKKLLIGTQKADELNGVMKQLQSRGVVVGE